jgi:hypothetical protein
VRPFGDLEARIDALCRRASWQRDDPALLVEMEDVLTEGYVRALEADRVSRETAQALRLRLAVVHDRWVALRASGPA